MTGRRIAAAGLLIVGAGALGFSYLQYRRQRSLASPLVRFEVVESHPIVSGLVEGSARFPILGDGPRAQVPDTPPAGHLYHVAPSGNDANEGARERPWRDLARALCRLEPGDRLYVLPGTYRGPFAISSECRDGTADRPIEVYASDDATLVPGADESEPVLTVARAYWQIEGIEVSGGPTAAPAIRFAAGARHVALVAAHVYGSMGDGIHIAPGSEDLTIRDTHLHHFGSARAAGESDREPSAERIAAVRVFPGTRGIRIEDDRLHNIDGDLVRVVTPEEYLSVGGELLPAAADVIIDREEFQSDQEEW